MTDTPDHGVASVASPAPGAGHGHAHGSVDFDRAVVPILGLPFDTVTLEQAVERIREHAFSGVRCFVSTPNLHFAIAALSNPAFRSTVFRSDLSLIDGMPLVWIARFLGMEVPGRVAGADVFEALQNRSGPPVKVYLFGGPPGAAAEACDSINRRGGGVRCVGFDSAGFGSVESMSGDEQIERINRSGAQFVIASLGAEKGQAWLEHNAARLTAPVLAHLGAVLNFAAGTVRRAPVWMRWWGIEWLWRIKEEPALWRRYLSDGALALGVMISRVLPDIVVSRWRKHRAGAAPTIELQRSSGTSILRLAGFWADSQLAALRATLGQAVVGEQALVLDMARVQGVGSAFVALMLLARGHFPVERDFRIVNANRRVGHTFRRKFAEQLLRSPR